MDLSIAEANEVGRIMPRDDCSTQEAIDRYFGPDVPKPDVGSLSPETSEAISRSRRREQEERG